MVTIFNLLVNVGQITYKKQEMNFPTQIHLQTISYTYLGGEQILFFFNLKTAAIFDLSVKYGLNYLKDPRTKLDYTISSYFWYLRVKKVVLDYY